MGSPRHDIWELPCSVTLHLTEACNLRCRMCYEWGETGTYSSAQTKVAPRSLDIEVLKDTIRKLSPRYPFYSLFGGEPLIYPDLEELIVEVKRCGSRIDTPTNGTLLEKQAAMLVGTGFDSIRVSIDGPADVNDTQRGKGSYDKAIAGIEALFREREKPHAKGPLIGIIYTVTKENYRHIEQFFLHDLDLRLVNWVTIQMQNFITAPMGEAYAHMIGRDFGCNSDGHWKSMIRAPSDFADIDVDELSRQVNRVSAQLWEIGKPVLTLPKIISPENLRAYFRADWGGMRERYTGCPLPFYAFDITARGDIAPCHVFYDLTMGNVNERDILEIWFGDRHRSFRERMKKQRLLPICQGCCLLYINGAVEFKGC